MRTLLCVLTMQLVVEIFEEILLKVREISLKISLGISKIQPKFLAI